MKYEKLAELGLRTPPEIIETLKATEEANHPMLVVSLDDKESNVLAGRLLEAIEAPEKYRILPVSKETSEWLGLPWPIKGVLVCMLSDELYEAINDTFEAAVERRDPELLKHMQGVLDENERLNRRWTERS